jgi:hypothetical protein
VNKYRAHAFLLILICFGMLACSRKESGTPFAAKTEPVFVKRLSVTACEGLAVALTDNRTDSIFAEATSLLQTDDGIANNHDGDVRCMVELSKDGVIFPFPNGGINIINNGEDYRTVCNYPGYVHVVDQINWCNDIYVPGGSIIGCSDNPGTCMVVTRPAGTFTSDMEGLLWAHEYGHTKGLGHSCESGCTSAEDDRIMHPIINSIHRKIGLIECNAYRN